MNLSLELRLVVYTNSGETLQSLQTKLSAKHLSQSGDQFSSGDSASRSIVKARGQDNIFSALESKQWRARAAVPGSCRVTVCSTRRCSWARRRDLASVPPRMCLASRRGRWPWQTACPGGGGRHPLKAVYIRATNATARVECPLYSRNQHSTR